MKRFLEAEENYLAVRINTPLTLRERVMAPLISGGKPQSVELQNLFGSSEELRASRAGPSEERIEGQLYLTQEQIPLSVEIMEHLTAMLLDQDFNVQESRGPLSGTERLFYPINARANFVDHPNVGVARMSPTNQLEKAGAMDRELLYVVTGSTVMWIRFAARPPRLEEGSAPRLLQRRAGRRKRGPVQRPGSHPPGWAGTRPQRATRSCLRRSCDR